MAYKATTIEELIATMKRVQGDKTLTQFAAELERSKQCLSNLGVPSARGSHRGRDSWRPRA
jgi:hypothetical protein